ncbi:MAG TPA: hypothetical protein VNQ73_07350 [Ilumatobacter sp.]|nr:hypothetical protein [Ilumatobacter sp.]
MHRSTHQLTDNLIDHRLCQLSAIELSIVRSRHLPPIVPPCRVCGADLEVVSIGAGHATKYACSSPEARRAGSRGAEREQRLVALRHYHDSEVRIAYHDDPLTVAAIDELLARRAAAGEPVDVPVGTVHVDGIESMPLVYQGDGRWERECRPLPRFAAVGG